MASITTDSFMRFVDLDQQGITSRAHSLLATTEMHGGECAAALEHVLEERWRVHALTASAGLPALQLVLLAAGVKHGDAVIVPAFAPSETVTAILGIGAHPHIVDITEDTFSLDPVETRLALESSPRRVAAIIALHLFGQPIMLRALRGLREEYGVPLIEDATDAPGVEHIGQCAGTMAGGGGDFGYVALSSTTPLLVFDQAGIMLCPDEERKERLKQARERGLSRQTIPSNVRMNAFAAAFLLVGGFDALNQWNERKTRVAARLAEGLQALPVQLPQTISGWRHGSHAYPIVTRTEDERNRLVSHLVSEGIMSRCISSMYLPTQFPGSIMSIFGEDCPRAERLARLGLTVPCTPDLSDADVAFLIAGIREWYNR